MIQDSEYWFGFVQLTVCLVGFFFWPVQVKHKDNTFMESQYTFQSHYALVKNTMHLSKTQCTSQKHNVLVKNIMYLSTTQCTCLALVKNKLHLLRTQCICPK